jgi:flagellar biosynthesis chaperone FliJ
VLGEQLAHARDVADDAYTRALVASTPLADRERREATEDLRRTQRMYDETAQRLQELRAEQDRLLERLEPRS